MIPMKLYLLPTMLFPNGKLNLALTAKTYARRLGERQNDDKYSATYVEALGQENRQIHYTQRCHWGRSAMPIALTDRLSLSKCLDLLRSGKGLPLVVDEVGAVFLEVA